MTLRRYLRLHAPTARGAAVRAAEVARALSPRRAPGCPPACSESHTDVWPCELADEGPRVALAVRLAERGALLDAVAEALACHRCDAPIGGRCAVPGGYAPPCRFRRPALPRRRARVDEAPLVKVAEPHGVNPFRGADLRIEVSPAAREAMDRVGREMGASLREAFANLDLTGAGAVGRSMIAQADPAALRRRIEEAEARARAEAIRTHPDRTGRLR